MPRCRSSGCGTTTRSPTTGRTARSLGAAYAEKRIGQLQAVATRAFLDYAPIRPQGADELERVYRKVGYGPHLDVFALDMRSYRGPNTPQPAGDGRAGDRLPRARADPLAAARAAGEPGDLEGDRRRHAGRPAGAGRQGCRRAADVRGGGQWRRPGRWAASWRSPGCSRPSRRRVCATSSG